MLLGLSRPPAANNTEPTPSSSASPLGAMFTHLQEVAQVAAGWLNMGGAKVPDAAQNKRISDHICNAHKHVHSAAIALESFLSSTSSDSESLRTSGQEFVNQVKAALQAETKLQAEDRQVIKQSADGKLVMLELHSALSSLLDSAKKEMPDSMAQSSALGAFEEARRNMLRELEQQFEVSNFGIEIGQPTSETVIEVTAAVNAAFDPQNPNLQGLYDAAQHGHELDRKLSLSVSAHASRCNREFAICVLERAENELHDIQSGIAADRREFSRHLSDLSDGVGAARRSYKEVRRVALVPAAPTPVVVEEFQVPETSVQVQPLAPVSELVEASPGKALPDSSPQIAVPAETELPPLEALVLAQDSLAQDGGLLSVEPVLAEKPVLRLTEVAAETPATLETPRRTFTPGRFSRARTQIAAGIGIALTVASAWLASFSNRSQDRISAADLNALAAPVVSKLPEVKPEVLPEKAPEVKAEQQIASSEQSNHEASDSTFIFGNNPEDFQPDPMWLPAWAESEPASATAGAVAPESLSQIAQTLTPSPLPPSPVVEIPVQIQDAEAPKPQVTVAEVGPLVPLYIEPGSLQEELVGRPELNELANSPKAASQKGANSELDYGSLGQRLELVEVPAPQLTSSSGPTESAAQFIEIGSLSEKLEVELPQVAETVVQPLIELDGMRAPLIDKTAVAPDVVPAEPLIELPIGPAQLAPQFAPGLDAAGFLQPRGLVALLDEVPQTQTPAIVSSFIEPGVLQPVLKLGALAQEPALTAIEPRRSQYLEIGSLQPELRVDFPTQTIARAVNGDEELEIGALTPKLIERTDEKVRYTLVDKNSSQPNTQIK